MIVSIVPEPSIPVRQTIRSPMRIRLSAAATSIATLIWPARVIVMSGTRTIAHSSPQPSGAWNPARRETRITRKSTSWIRSARSLSSSTTSA